MTTKLTPEGEAARNTYILQYRRQGPDWNAVARAAIEASEGYAAGTADEHERMAYVVSRAVGDKKELQAKYDALVKAIQQAWNEDEWSEQLVKLCRGDE